LKKSLGDLLPLDCLRNATGDIGTTRPFLIVVCLYISK
jgi:hypothetical protein